MPRSPGACRHDARFAPIDLRLSQGIHEPADLAQHYRPHAREALSHIAQALSGSACRAVHRHGGHRRRLLVDRGTEIGADRLGGFRAAAALDFARFRALLLAGSEKSGTRSALDPTVDDSCFERWTDLGRRRRSTDAPSVRDLSGGCGGGDRCRYFCKLARLFLLDAVANRLHAPVARARDGFRRRPVRHFADHHGAHSPCRHGFRALFRAQAQ